MKKLTKVALVVCVLNPVMVYIFETLWNILEPGQGFLNPTYLSGILFGTWYAAFSIRVLYDGDRNSTI